jgi:signal transduction histidine kinase
LQEELEQTNEALARALEEAESARHEAENANSAKSQFLTIMSHELRTPLNAISGYIDLLDMGLRGPLTREQRHDLLRIKRNEETLLRLVEDILSFAKLESGRFEYRFEDVALNGLAASLETFIAPRLEQKSLRYWFEPCEPDVTIPLDRAKVEQIMLNLLSNAVKFTDAGTVGVRCTADSANVRIRVEDTGRGISPELLDTIFEPFVQGDRSLTRTAEGTGLGLSISRQLARAMGGDIIVESASGAGSTFTLVLPRDRPALARPANVTIG